MLMITMSDNTASVWLQKLVTANISIVGCSKMVLSVCRVNSPVKGRETVRSIYGWGVTTPLEMCRCSP